MNVFALSLAPKQRHGTIRKCIGCLCSSLSDAEINHRLFYLESNSS